jgi:hypothetical protein
MTLATRGLHSPPHQEGSRFASLEKRRDLGGFGICFVSSHLPLLNPIHHQLIAMTSLPMVVVAYGNPSD